MEFMVFCYRNSMGHECRGVKKLCYAGDGVYVCVKNGLILVWAIVSVSKFFSLWFSSCTFCVCVIVNVWKNVFFFYSSDFGPLVILIFTPYRDFYSINVRNIQLVLLCFSLLRYIWNSISVFVTFHYVDRPLDHKKNDVFNYFDTARD